LCLREAERDRERQRETVRDRERQRKAERDRERERIRDRGRNRDRERQIVLLNFGVKNDKIINSFSYSFHLSVCLSQIKL
jgi:hypothetical protein